MAKLAFEQDNIFGRSLHFEDNDGDKLFVAADNPSSGGYFLGIQTGTQGAMVGLKRKQAIKLAKAILKEATVGKS